MKMETEVKVRKYILWIFMAIVSAMVLVFGIMSALAICGFKDHPVFMKVSDAYGRTLCWSIMVGFVVYFGGMILLGLGRLLRGGTNIMRTATATPWPPYDHMEIDWKKRDAMWVQVGLGLTVFTVAGIKYATESQNQWLEAAIIGGTVCMAMFAGLFALWTNMVTKTADRHYGHYGVD